MAKGITGLRTEDGITTLWCNGEFEASWKPFEFLPQASDAVKIAYERGKRDQAAETAATLRNIFGLKG